MRPVPPTTPEQALVNLLSERVRQAASGYPPPRHVYTHVPFCARRCSYCDFAIAVRREVPVSEYLDALEAELSIRLGAPERHEVDTLYFGGGTPSRLGGRGLGVAVELVSRWYQPAASAEITAEVNPEDVSGEVVTQWLEAGINRVSLGGQSFNDDVLTWMHRTHDSSATSTAVQVMRAAGIRDLSLDLIFALPAHLRRNFPDDVERVLELEPDHISLYGLTVEPHTPLGHWVADGITVEQNEDGYEEDFLFAHERLTSAGYQHYEVSNYARPGRRAMHNSAYWSGVPYVGLGPAAHGFDGVVRRWNARNYAAWCALLTEGKDPVEGSETLDQSNRLAESVYLGLRSDSGLELAPGDADLIEPWTSAGWVCAGADGRVRCTPTGWLRLDALATALTHHRSR